MIPKFLLKSIVILLLSLTALVFTLLKIQPANALVVAAFLFALLIVTSNFLSIVYFLFHYRGQQRVWYLKEGDYTIILRRSLFVGLLICLSLLLKYLEMFNYYSLGLLVAILLAGNYFSSRY